MNLYADKSLSEKLEKTEASCNAEFVRSRAKLFPDRGAEWIEVGGTYALYDGVDSPITQTFGLGLFENLTLSTVKEIEKFYDRFSAPIFHEVSPFADSTHLDILYQCGYQPVELSSILYKPLLNNNCSSSEIATRIMKRGEEKRWASTSAEAWGMEAPGLSKIIYEFAEIAAQSYGVEPFFAELNGKSIATGLIYIKEDIALLAGDSTIVEGRNRGAQSALIDARLNHAAEQGCTIAMMATSPGSQSQKNAEKKGFRLAYTRTKWKLASNTIYQK